MTKSTRDDEMTLIDFLLGECDDTRAEAVRSRLARDASFRKLRDAIERTVAAIRLAPEVEPPHDLVEKTLARIQSARQTEALIAREEFNRRVFRPTFSLRELGALAAVVVLLAIILIPSIRKARQLTLAGQCRSYVGRIGTALHIYANDNDDYLPGLSAQNARWLPAEGQPAVSNSAGLFRLVTGHYEEPVVFQCPAVGGRSFEIRAGMLDFPKDEHISYSYQHALGAYLIRRSDPSLMAVAETMVILADSTPLFRDGKFCPERLRNPISDNHDRAGHNVLYLDMHAGWAELATVGVGNDNIFMAGGICDYQGDERTVSQRDTFLLPAFTAESPPR